jgi:hypothetical protein
MQGQSSIDGKKATKSPFLKQLWMPAINTCRRSSWVVTNKSLVSRGMAAWRSTSEVEIRPSPDYEALGNRM